MLDIILDKITTIIITLGKPTLLIKKRRKLIIIIILKSLEKITTILIKS